jgi:hypothetical protein
MATEQQDKQYQQRQGEQSSAYASEGSQRQINEAFTEQVAPQSSGQSAVLGSTIQSSEFFRLAEDTSLRAFRLAEDSLRIAHRVSESEMVKSQQQQGGVRPDPDLIRKVALQVTPWVTQQVIAELRRDPSLLTQQSTKA